MIKVISEKRRAQIRAAVKRYNEKYPERVKATRKKRIERDPQAFAEKVVQYNKTQWEKHPEKKQQCNARWRTANKEYIRAKNATYRAEKSKRTVSWDEELTDFVCHEAHALARLREKVTGFRWHVDHILPLRGRCVSGLHTWNNLQVIPAVDNIKKRNLFQENL